MTTRWMPSLPMAHRVPRKWACSLRAWVIFVFSARKRELEALTEEGFQFFLYLFRKLSRPADPHEPIVGIPQIFEADEVGVIDLHGGDTSDLSYQFAEFFCTRCSFLHEAQFSFGELLVEKIFLLPLATSLYLLTHFLDFFIQFVQIHESSDRACQAALRGTCQTIVSCFSQVQVSCSKQFPDEVKEAFISNLFPKQVD